MPDWLFWSLVGLLVVLVLVFIVLRVVGKKGD
jgi:hypothetical protein